jgi:hypothetical protein
LNRQRWQGAVVVGLVGHVAIASVAFGDVTVAALAAWYTTMYVIE